MRTSSIFILALSLSLLTPEVRADKQDVYSRIARMCGQLAKQEGMDFESKCLDTLRSIHRKGGKDAEALEELIRHISDLNEQTLELRKLKEKLE